MQELAGLQKPFRPRVLQNVRADRHYGINLDSAIGREECADFLGTRHDAATRNDMTTQVEQRLPQERAPQKLCSPSCSKLTQKGKPSDPKNYLGSRRSIDKQVVNCRIPGE